MMQTSQSITLAEPCAVLQIMQVHKCSLPEANRLVEDMKTGKIAAVFLRGGKFIKYTP